MTNFASCGVLSGNFADAPNLTSKSVLNAPRPVQSVRYLPNMLWRHAEVPSDATEKSVNFRGSPDFGRDTFKVVVQSEPQIRNIPEDYSLRLLQSREICVPAKRKDTDPRRQRITQVRSDLGLNQDEFAAALGIEQGTVSKWQTGRAVPGTHTYVILAALAKTEELREFLLADGGESARRAFDAVFRGDMQAVGGKNEGPPSESLDVDLLTFVIKTMLGGLRKNKLELPDEKLSELIALCYDFCCKTRSRDPAIVERFLRVA